MPSGAISYPKEFLFTDLAVTVVGRNAGWSSSVARRAHNPKVGGSNPPPATNRTVASATHHCWGHY